MKPFIIVVARNNRALTMAAVRSAQAQEPAADVLLIDNASTDGTREYCIAKSRTAIMILLDKQISLAAAWNKGLRAAWLLGHEHAMIINNDVELRLDTYHLLLAHGGPFVTCVSVDSADRLNYPEPPTTERPHPDFSAFLIRKSVTDAVGWFDEEMFPAYCEDSDYHVRMHRAGIKAVCIDLPFLHHGASTLKHAPAGEKKAIERGARMNRERFQSKYGCLPGTPEYEALFK